MADLYDKAADQKALEGWGQVPGNVGSFLKGLAEGFANAVSGAGKAYGNSLRELQRGTVGSSLPGPQQGSQAPQGESREDMLRRELDPGNRAWDMPMVPGYKDIKEKAAETGGAIQEAAPVRGGGGGGGGSGGGGGKGSGELDAFKFDPEKDAVYKYLIDEIDRRNRQDSETDLTPGLALVDALTGSQMAQSYRAPENTVEGRQKAIRDLQGKVASRLTQGQELAEKQKLEVKKALLARQTAMSKLQQEAALKREGFKNQKEIATIKAAAAADGKKGKSLAAEIYQQDKSIMKAAAAKMFGVEGGKADEMARRVAVMTANVVQEYVDAGMDPDEAKALAFEKLRKKVGGGQQD